MASRSMTSKHLNHDGLPNTNSGLNTPKHMKKIQALTPCSRVPQMGEKVIAMWGKKKTPYKAVVVPAPAGLKSHQNCVCWVQEDSKKTFPWVITSLKQLFCRESPSPSTPARKRSLSSSLQESAGPPYPSHSSTKSASTSPSLKESPLLHKSPGPPSLSEQYAPPSLSRSRPSAKAATSLSNSKNKIRNKKFKKKNEGSAVSTSLRNPPSLQESRASSLSPRSQSIVMSPSTSTRPAKLKVLPSLHESSGKPLLPLDQSRSRSSVRSSTPISASENIMPIDTKLKRRRKEDDTRSTNKNKQLKSDLSSVKPEKKKPEEDFQILIKTSSNNIRKKPNLKNQEKIQQICKKFPVLKEVFISLQRLENETDYQGKSIVSKSSRPASQPEGSNKVTHPKPASKVVQPEASLKDSQPVTVDVSDNKDPVTRSRRHSSGTEKEYQNVEGPSDKFLCPKCGKGYPSNKMLLEHEKVHALMPFRCKLCSRKFSVELTLREHIDRIHNKVKNSACEICGVSVYSERELNLHKSRVHVKGEDHKCTICEKTFFRAADIKSHMAVHLDDKLHRCSWCPSKFHNIHILKQHLKIHSKEKSVYCGLCGMGFNTHFMLGKHYNTMHRKVKPWSCKDCGKDFKDKNILALHLQEHAAEKWYECETCKKTYAKLPYLKLHERTHNNEKRWKCPTCDKCFSNKSNLKTHLRVHARK